MALGWKAATATKSCLKYLSSGNSGQRLPQKSRTPGGTPRTIKCTAVSKAPFLRPSPGSPPRLLPLSFSVRPLAEARMCNVTAYLFKKQQSLIKEVIEHVEPPANRSLFLIPLFPFELQQKETKYDNTPASSHPLKGQQVRKSKSEDFKGFQLSFQSFRHSG